jgi:hypothetical protein
VIRPAMEQLLPALDSPEARVLLVAIGLQETRFQTRRQYGDGPARGYWQFELGGGVHGIMEHRMTRLLLADICEIREVKYDARTIWRALEFDDLLACACARLLLFSDPKRLPALGKGGEAWDYYIANWRPGRPHVRTWNGYYAQALEAVYDHPVNA